MSLCLSYIGSIYTAVMLHVPDIILECSISSMELIAPKSVPRTVISQSQVVGVIDKSTKELILILNFSLL